MSKVWLMLAMVAMSTGVGCQPPRASEGGFDSPDPASKLYAIHRAGQQRDASAIPHLIEQLNNDDPAVRMYAIEALERITGSRLGYSPYASLMDRNEAVLRWAEAYKAGQIKPLKSTTEAAAP
jgi:HEAT repeat protein